MMSRQLWIEFERLTIAYNTHPSDENFKAIEAFEMEYRRVFLDFEREPVTIDNLAILGFQEVYSSDNVNYYTRDDLTGGLKLTTEWQPCLVDKFDRFQFATALQYLRNMNQVIHYTGLLNNLRNPNNGI